MQKHLKRALSIIFLTAVIIAIINLLNYMYFRPDAVRVTWQSFYNQEKNIDTVFIGSSHVFCDVDTDVSDRLLNCNTFDLATPGQTAEETYYVLKEASSRYDIKNVYIELAEGINSGTDAEILTGSWTVTDYMKSGLPRLEALYVFNDAEHLPESLFPFIRFRAYLGDYNYISETIQNKESEDYKNYIYKEGPYELTLETKGFFKTNDYMVRDKDLKDIIPDSGKSINGQSSITRTNAYYLKKCIDYCMKNNIEITLFISPVYAGDLIKSGSRDAYLKSLKDITDDYNLCIYDFNLIRGDYLNLETTDFYDEGHLNSSGAKKFTETFMNILNDENTDMSKYFYDSWNEKFEAEYAWLYN